MTTDVHVRPGVFRITTPISEALPLIFDSPHSGTVVPHDFKPAVPAHLWRQNADHFVDDLFSSGPSQGAALLAAEFPRVYIDPNRAEDDIDPADTPGWTGPANPSEKTRLGKGLVWRRVKPAATPLYDTPISAAEVRHRLETYYRPYHTALRGLIDAARRGHGVAFHLNCHSMLALSGAMDAEGSGIARADFVLSDREGTTTAPDFLDAARSALERRGYRVAINTPFKGAELVRRTGRPQEGVHALQIEVNRKLYLAPIGESGAIVRGPGYQALKADLDGFVADLARFVSDAAFPPSV